MVDSSELDCKIYVDSEQTLDELAAFVTELIPGAQANGSVSRIIRMPLGELEVRKNNQADELRARAFPDGFLYFLYTLESYPLPTVGAADRTTLTANLLNRFWSHGLPAVAACDYEGELPNGGGYNNRSVPWPSPRASGSRLRTG